MGPILLNKQLGERLLLQMGTISALCELFKQLLRNRASINKANLAEIKHVRDTRQYFDENIQTDFDGHSFIKRENDEGRLKSDEVNVSFAIVVVNINLLAYYDKCCNSIGYATHCLFHDRQRVE